MTIGFIDLGTARQVKLSNVAYWERLLTETERNQYLNNPSVHQISGRSKYWTNWNAMLEAVITSDELGPSFSDSRLQVIPPPVGATCLGAIALPAHIQCPRSCEHIPYWELGKTPCIDSTATFDDIDHYNSGIRLNQIISHGKLGENILQGLDSVTVCVAVKGRMSGTLLDYGDSSLLIHIQSVESILVKVHHSHHVFFPVILLQKIQRVCLRIKKGRVDAFVDGIKLKDHSYQGKIKSTKFGKGKVSLFVASQGNKIPMEGEVHGLSIWPRGLSDVEMSIFSSVHQCLDQPNTSLSWKDVTTAIADERALFKAQYCNNNGLGLNFLDLSIFESFSPPSSLGKNTIMITAKQIDNNKTEEKATFSLGAGEDICIKLNLPVNHTGKNFTMYAGLENPLGLSYKVLTISEEEVGTYVCYFCDRNTLILPLKFPEGKYERCIKDSRKPHDSIAGYPVTNSTGMTINRILLIEDKEWACKEELAEDKLFGDFIWTSTDTSSDAICPFGKKTNNLFIAYAQRMCINNTWSSSNDTKQCQYELEDDSLEYLLNTTETEGRELSGEDLRIAITSAVKHRTSSGIDPDLFRRTLTYVEKAILKTLEDGEDICWFMTIFNALYECGQGINSKADLFPIFKLKFLPKFVEGRYPLVAADCSKNVFQASPSLNSSENTLHCFSSDVLACSKKNRSLSSAKQDYNLSLQFELTSPRRVTVTLFKHISVTMSGSKAFSRNITDGKLNKGVRVVSDIISIYEHEADEAESEVEATNSDDELKVIYNFRNLNEDRITNSYCAQEILDQDEDGSYNWTTSGISLLTRTSNEVTCEGSGRNQTVALIQNIQPHDQRSDNLKLIIKLMDGIVMVLLLCTALIAASRIHECIPAANTVTILCVLYSTYYLVHVICDTTVSFLVRPIDSSTNQMQDCHK